MTYSLVCIVPDEHKPQIEAAGAALGHSGAEYGVPLSADGSEPATHWGFNANGSTATRTLAIAGSLPDRDPTDEEQALVDDALSIWTEAEITALRSLYTASVRPDAERKGHFWDVIAEMGLTRLLGPEELI